MQKNYLSRDADEYIKKIFRLKELLINVVINKLNEKLSKLTKNIFSILYNPQSHEKHQIINLIILSKKGFKNTIN